MRVDVVFLPFSITQDQLIGRSVAVFDVLRATTSMAAALAAGVGEIQVFPTTAAASRAAGPPSPRRLLCGEENCLPPTGFDLGNSPGSFALTHRGRVMHMSTTNGTRAIVACRGASVVYPAALVNAGAVARALLGDRRDVTLLCAGTAGAIALEDLVGAGAVLDALQELRDDIKPGSDDALIAHRLFQSARSDLRSTLASSRGGQNVISAGLSADIEFAARLDALEVVGRIDEPAAEPPVIKPLEQSQFGRM